MLRGLIAIIYEVFGREFGRCGFQIKLKISIGVLALNPSQLWRTCIGERWSPLPCAVVVEQAEKQFCMHFGSVTKSKLAGVMPS